MPISRCRRLSSDCISWRSLRSRAPRGSSSSSTRGRLTMARASATRWRCPPESSAGLRPPRPSSRTMRSASSPRRHALRPRHALGLEAVGDVLGHRHVREQRIVLEHGVDVAGVRRQARHVPPAQLDEAPVRPLEACDQPEARRLARARGPEHREELAGPHLDVDMLDRDRAPVALVDAGEADDRWRLRRRSGGSRRCPLVEIAGEGCAQRLTLG